jgi:DNA polymerase-3 subunit epsilon
VKPEETVFVAFDTETTGLIAGVDRLVEVAAVAFRGERILREHEQLVDPGIPIPPGAQAINNISDEMVRGKPSIREALPGLLAVLHEGIPVAHNAGFDAGFLLPEIERTGFRAPDTPILDTRGLARAAFPGRQSYGLDNLSRDPDVRGLAGDPVGGPPGGLGPGGAAHRALADAHACMALFKACARRLTARGCGSVEDLLRLSGPRLDLGAHAPRQPRFAAMLEEARQAGASVEIEYVSASGEGTVREIKPLAFGVMGGAAVVRAFCRLRNQERTFRLDAIRELRRLT